MTTHGQAKKLIDELMYNAKASGNRTLERRLADLTAWYYMNIDSFASNNVEGQVAFLKKAFWIMLEQQALLIERLHEVESAGKSKHLWLPKGMMVEGDMREYD